MPSSRKMAETSELLSLSFFLFLFCFVTRTKRKCRWAVHTDGKFRKVVQQRRKQGAGSSTEKRTRGFTSEADAISCLARWCATLGETCGSLAGAYRPILSDGTQLSSSLTTYSSKRRRLPSTFSTAASAQQAVKSQSIRLLRRGTRTT